MKTKYWLVKTEPAVYSIDDLKRDRKTRWDNVRNYQARNFLREMARGDLVLIYHSNADPSGVVGVAEVVREAYPDPSQFDPQSDSFDPKATPHAPRWFCPDFKFRKVLPRFVPISELRTTRGLEKLLLLRPGNRLSVLPITEREFGLIIELAKA